MIQWLNNTLWRTKRSETANLKSAKATIFELDEEDEPPSPKNKNNDVISEKILNVLPKLEDRFLGLFIKRFEDQSKNVSKLGTDFPDINKYAFDEED